MSDCNEDAPPAKKSRLSAPEDKKPVVEAEAEVPASILYGTGLLDLPDSLILLTFSYLPLPYDRFGVGGSCRRLRKINCDYSLWEEVNLASAKHMPMPLRSLKRCVGYLCDRTRSLSIRGFLKTRFRDRINVSHSLFETISQKCPRLERLTLTECRVDRTALPNEYLPSSLTDLSLAQSEFVNAPSKDSWFGSIHVRLSHLKTLDLSGCQWMSNHCLMALCKIEQLESLSLQGCFRIGEAFAYTALSCRFGFRKLKHVDLRDTNSGQNELNSFGRLPELVSMKLGRTAAEAEVEQPDQCESDGVISDRELQNLMNAGVSDHLKELTITHCPGVTNRISTMLATRLMLNKLDVQGTKFRLSGANTITKRRPDCQIVLDPLPLEEGEEEAPVIMPDSGNQIIIIQQQH